MNLKQAIDVAHLGKLTSLFSCLSKTTEFFVISVLALFSVVTLSAAQLFRRLNSKILQFCATPHTMSTDDVLIFYLDRWRRQHTLVCQLVDEIQSFFGVVLLVALIHSFVSLITDSFEITMALKKSDHVLIFVFLVRFFLNLLRFGVVCFVSWYLESEVYIIAAYIHNGWLFITAIHLHCFNRPLGHMNASVK